MAHADERTIRCANTLQVTLPGFVAFRILDAMNGQIGSGEELGLATPQSHLRERELAQRWTMSQRTLQRWRKEGFGPAYILIGGTIRYRMADVLDYEHRHLHDGSRG